MSALRISAAEGPSRLVVFPVTMRPSASSMARAGAAVSSSRLTGCGDYGTILRSQARFLHDHLQPVHLRLLGAPLDLPATRGVIPANDLLTGGLPQASSSVMQFFIMFTPISVGDL